MLPVELTRYDIELRFASAPPDSLESRFIAAMEDQVVVVPLARKDSPLSPKPLNCNPIIDSYQVRARSTSETFNAT